MRLRKRFRWPVFAAALVVLAGGGTAYAVGRSDSGPHYRTVAAATGDVEETLTTTGLVDAARRSDLSFATGGTVGSVKVRLGQHVKTGQVIATLDPTALDAKVTDARATLVKAVAQLASDESAQSSSVQNANQNQSQNQSAAKNPSTGSTKPSASSAALIKLLQAQQQAVVEAQSAVSAALAAAKDALAAQTAACANAYGSSSTPTSSPTATPTASPSPDPANAACDAALADVQAKQASSQDAEDALAKALDMLAGTLAKSLGGSLGGSHGSPSARTAAITPSAAATGNTGNTGSTGSTGATITAAQLASDQARIDQAHADLVSATAAREQATLRSTRTGQVVALSIAPGDAASAGTAVATVVGGRAVTLTTTVAETSISRIKVGEIARVSVPGQAKTTEGRVTAVGLVADTSTGTTSYPVTVTVEDPSIALPTGSRAQLSIVLSTARNVVTLPISAVSGTGSTATVRTWDGTTLASRQVRIGAVGERTVEVTSGLTAGTSVVLADLSQAIKGASSQLNQRGGFGSGNFPAFQFRNGSGGGPQTSVSSGKG